ncbi:MAG: hypothetical protein ACREBT_00345 [Thermoplasmata archaeon]
MTPPLDVYLMPAVVGGGRGDIDEVLVAGHYLRRAGFEPMVYRRAGRPLPREVDGPWDWPRHRRISALRPNASRALTVTPCWGVSAAPSRDEPFGRGGPWEPEASDIERRYGSDRTLHVSLEEFARTLTSRQESAERWREGGRTAQEIRAWTRRPEFSREAAAYRRAYRRFRAFDRENVVHLYATFQPSIAFAREYPEAIQCGPLWPIHGRRARSRPARRGRSRTQWMWYASPSSAERIAPRVLEGLARAPGRPQLIVRVPRRWALDLRAEDGTVSTATDVPVRWHRALAAADLRIVTGSRTLLEAIGLGGPFLYFNGILGTGASTHRHRPEKLDRMLAVAPFPKDVQRDLRDFARGRRIASVVRRASRRAGGWGRWPSGPWTQGFPSRASDAGRLLVSIARSFAATTAPSPDVVRALRAGRPPPSR